MLNDVPGSVTNQERDLVLTVASENHQVLIFIYNIREVCRRGKDLDYLKILSWLKKNRLVGTAFLDWLKTNHENAIVMAVSDIRMKIHRDSKMRPIFAKRGLQ